MPPPRPRPGELPAGEGADPPFRRSALFEPPDFLGRRAADAVQEESLRLAPFWETTRFPLLVFDLPQGVTKVLVVVQFEKQSQKKREIESTGNSMSMGIL